MTLICKLEKYQNQI